MARAYFPVLMLLGFVAVNAVLMIAASTLLLRSRPTPVKQQAYESGVPALGDARERFSVRFYLVAILFIIFDLEIAFLFPWGVVLGDLGVWSAGFWAMMMFLAILTVGFIYEWNKGALDWE